MESQEQAHHLVQELEGLQNDRSNFDAHCQEVAERVAPMYRHEFSGGSGPGASKGESRHQNVFDSTAVLALEKYASIMESLLTPRSQRWHRLTASNPDVAKDSDAKEWFEKVTDILFRYRYAPKANFSSQNSQVFTLLGAFGNGPLYIDELDSEPALRYKCCSLGSTYFKENHQGVIDTAFRTFTWTARQAYQAWGEKLPGDIKEKATGSTKDRECEFEFFHAVKPRTDVDRNRRDFKGMPFASYYVARKGPFVITEKGFRTFPWAISRHKNAPGETYARSPAMEVMPAIRTVNEQKKTLLKQAHRAVDQVLLAHDDGVASRFSLRPGAINTGGVTRDGRPLIHALPVGNVSLGMDMMELERADIRDVFMLSVFQILLDSPRMSATEVLERTKEKGILISPAFARQESEYLGPMIEREISILEGLRLLPPAPRILQEAKGEYTIVYDSPFSRTQKAEEASGLMRVYEWALNVANAKGDPSILDYFDEEKIVPEIADIQGMPVRWMRAKDEVEALRQQRSEAAARQEAVNAAPGAAAMTKAAAVAAEKAPEAMAQIMGGGA
jgi:hypothetical protein